MIGMNQRIGALSDEQRVSLARRIGLDKDGGRSKLTRSRLQLVAFLVAEQDSAIDISALREYARERLPDYMMPNKFVLLDHLPRLPNGKLDKKALTRLDLDLLSSLASDASNLVAPRTLLEQKIAGIWADVLGTDLLSVDDSFFDAGGDSLLAMRVVSRIGREFQINIPMNSFFQVPTIAGLANCVRNLVDEGEEQDGEEREQFVL